MMMVKKVWDGDGVCVCVGLTWGILYRRSVGVTPYNHKHWSRHAPTLVKTEKQNSDLKYILVL